LALGGSRAPTQADVAALDQAFQTTGASFTGGELAATLSSDHIAALSSSSAQLNAAVEQIFGQSTGSLARGSLLQPSNSQAADSHGTAVDATLPSGLVLGSEDLSTDDPGQVEVSNDILQNPAVKL
jgi:hypothetical protein